MNIIITPFQFGEIIKQQYSLDHIAILKLVNDNIELGEMIEGSKRFAALYQSAIRKGILTEDGSAVSNVGKELLQYLEDRKEEKSFVRKKESSDFDSWWGIFPPTDNFVYEDIKFTGCRNLRLNKEECRLKFERLVSDGLYTAEEIIEATRYDVLQKMRESVRKKSNKLTYLQNSLTYLRQHSFESFIELIDKKESDDDENDDVYI